MNISDEDRIRQFQQAYLKEKGIVKKLLKQNKALQSLVTSLKEEVTDLTEKLATKTTKRKAPAKRTAANTTAKKTSTTTTTKTKSTNTNVTVDESEAVDGTIQLSD